MSGSAKRYTSDKYALKLRIAIHSVSFSPIKDRVIQEEMNPESNNQLGLN